MTNYRTMPNKASKPKPKYNLGKRPVPARKVVNATYPPVRPKQAPRKSAKKSKLSMWLILLPIGLMGVFLLGLVGSYVIFQLSFANRILPQVEVAGIDVGNMTEAEAISYLTQAWSTLSLSDGSQTWQTNSVDLGLTLDADSSIEQALAIKSLSAIFRPVSISPIFSIDPNTMNLHLTSLISEIEQPALNAGVSLDNGVVSPTEPVYGTMIDIQATINALQANPTMLDDGVLELVMLDVAPTVTDSSALVAQAENILLNPLDIRVFDPVTGDSVYWSSLPEVWGNWLTATSDPSSPIGLALSVDASQVRAYLEQQAQISFDSSRTLDFDTAVASIQNAFIAGAPQMAFVTVEHTDRVHTVQSGESITSIAWDYGIPYLYVIQYNGGIESVSIGQDILIPPADYFIEGNLDPSKRIVVSISQQRTYVYENGQLLYEWVSSTGINDSPTWTGIYQILSHEPNAYAGNWNLYMPNFMGVYQPVPNSEFTNGFHGFPTRGGGQLLWENNLGTRVTYGCILLSDTHIAILYDWAQDGVIVEIRA